MKRTAITLICCFAILAGTVQAGTKLYTAAPKGAPGNVVSSTRDGRSPLDEIFNSTDVPMNIPDEGEATSDLVVGSAIDVGDVDVFVTITHTWVNDLQVYIMSPEGNEIQLFNRRGAGGAQNMTNTRFDDEAAQSIAQGAAPFTGSFRPEQPLTAFDGQSAQGTWVLRVVDNAAADVGTIVSWGIEVTPPNSDAGDVTGVVQAEGGEFLGEVHVSIVGTALTTCTSDEGSYEFTGVDAGMVSVRFQHEFYQPYTSPPQQLDAGSFLLVDATLTPWPDLISDDYPSSGAAVPISDHDSSFKTIVVGGDFVSRDIDVIVNITHTYNGDLDIFVRNPQGVSAQLAMFTNGLDIGDNYVNTRFDDEACAALRDGAAPYTGRFTPEIDQLTAVEGTNIAGTWRLAVFDNYDGDEGTIDNWTLITSDWTTVDADDPAAPVVRAFDFAGNYPNPFNASTQFRFNLNRESQASLVLYNALGQEAATVFNHHLSAGEHTAYFDASSLPSGVYIARLAAAGQTESRKLVLLK